MRKFAARYYYQMPGANNWNVLNVAFTTPQAAADLVARWTERDRGRLVWRWDECKPTDYDYPKE